MLKQPRAMMCGTVGHNHQPLTLAVGHCNKMRDLTDDRT